MEAELKSIDNVWYANLLAFNGQNWTLGIKRVVSNTTI